MEHPGNMMGAPGVFNWLRPLFWVTFCVVTCLTRCECAPPIGGETTIGETVSLSKSIFVLDSPATKSQSTSRNNVRIIPNQPDATKQNDEPLSEVHLARPRDGENDGGWPLQTLAQLEDPINQVRNDRSSNVSLYEAIKSQANRTRDEEQAVPLRGLDRDFLSLFDELWKIKNNSLTALVKLDYFREPDQAQSPAIYNDFSWPSRNLDPNKAILRDRSGQQAKLNVKNRVALAGSRISLWFSSAQQRIQYGWDALWTRIFHKLKLPVGQLGQSQTQTTRRTDIFDNTDKPNRPEEPDAKPNNTRALGKRSGETGVHFQEDSRGCATLSGEERNKCIAMEQQISLGLNNSFPGTLKSVEDNCKLITSLFTDCWPQNLRELRNSLASWNESILQHVDFPLPVNFLHQGALTGPVSCGVKPGLPQFLQDRINWMWLNLCIDKKFRQDYVDNLKCLSTWNQEKVQRVCSPEYRRMQNYLTSQSETGNAADSNFEWARGSNNQRTRQATPALSNGQKALVKTTERASTMSGSDEEMVGSMDQVMSANTSTRDISGVSVARGALSESELSDREVSSKMLCCMFDQFLRCAHKQALRDCGRPGAQFVVNFMSRIGTDDMKFLCNSETKSVHRVKSSNRRVESRSPFIEGQYCSDPRIQSGLSSHQLDRGGSQSGGSSFASGSRPSSSRNKLRDKTNISHDPTFFGSEIIVQSAALPLVRMDSSIVIILMLYHCFLSRSQKTHLISYDIEAELG